MSVNDASKIITDDSRVMLQIVLPLTDDFTGIIYDHNMLKVQATSLTHKYKIAALFKQG
jgi:hypothetical protein